MELFSIRIQRTFQLVSTVIGYSTVEQPPKKDRKRQNEIKKAGSNLRPFLKEQASEPHVCLCSFQTPSPYMEK